jgi:hypothetical protein
LSPFVNVQFSVESLRCRIERTELDRLLSGRAVSLEVPLPRNHVFRVSVRPGAIAADRGGWQLESDPTGIWLTVPRTELEALAQSVEVGVARDFAAGQGGNVRVDFGVASSLPQEESAT